ncbi:MAG: hypothetical protein L0L05_09580, partial [Yaniella sp.]|nr:hypothetical protein [Yaniella sp.]
PQLQAANDEAKAFNKTHKDQKKETYGAKITQLNKKIAYLEHMQEQAENSAISEHSQQLIDSGAVTQWQKKPVYYFVKGLRKVALTLDEHGDFQPSKRYPPMSEDAQQRGAAHIKQSAQAGGPGAFPDTSTVLRLMRFSRPAHEAGHSKPLQTPTKYHIMKANHARTDRQSRPTVERYQLVRRADHLRRHSVSQ